MKRAVKNFLPLAFSFLAAQPALANPFAGVRALHCEFLPGYTATWDTGKPVLQKGGFGGGVIFDSIDFAAGSARMLGNNAAPALTLLAEDGGMTFIEWLSGDTLVATTVFAHHPGGDSSRYSAAHSRHRMVGSPLPSQYHGVCESID